MAFAMGMCLIVDVFNSNVFSSESITAKGRYYFVNGLFV